MNISICPFCGKVPTLVIVEPTFLRKLVEHKSYYVECRNEVCRIHPRTDNYLKETSAIEIWNTRPNSNFPI
jgi:hypothetical protein